MAVMVAFPLSLVAILSSGPFSINADILGFFRNRSYTILALSFRRATGMPRTESSSAMSQNYLGFYYTSSVVSLLGSGLGSQCKSGPGSQIIGPHNSPSKSCCPISWSGRRILLMSGLYHGFAQICPSLMLVSLHLLGECAGLWDILLDLLTMRSCRFRLRGASLITSLYEANQI